MGLFDGQSAYVVNRVGGVDVNLLHKLECKACPLAQVACKSPNMPPSGSNKPLVYILGEAPGADEDARDEQFVGASGSILRPRIPKEFRADVRYNNVVRTRPPKNRTPTEVEIEACRPSIVRDIEKTKPVAIFGFGNVPLDWVSGYSGITLWRGRRMPVKVGNHTCWYYPMLHPEYIIRQERGKRRSPTDICSEDERMFALDLERAFDEVESLPKPHVHTREEAAAGVEILDRFGDEGVRIIEEKLAWYAKQLIVGVDYETNGIRPYAKGRKILTVAIGTPKGAFAFPYKHRESEWTPDQLERIKKAWIRFLREAIGVKAVHNLAFEMEWTGFFFGADLLRAGEWGDSQTQAAILDERKGGKGKHSGFALEFLGQQYFGINLKEISGVDRKSLDETPLEVVLHYNGIDAKYHALLFIAQDERIAAGKLDDAYIGKLRQVPTVVLTQLKGLPVDQDERRRLQKKYAKRIAETGKAIAALPIVKQYERKTGKTFNPLSNPELLEILRRFMKRKEVLVVDKYTKEEKYSADEKVLQAIQDNGDPTGLAKMIIALRKANKRKSTYIDPLSDDPEDARVSLIYPDGLLHAQFNTTFAETGRLSAEDPNLQNFPKRDGEAKEVRKQVRPPKKHLILSFDYGQIEARVIAMFTKDKRFCKALWERYDVHKEWAERIAYAYPDRVGGKKMLTDKKAMKDFRTDIKNQWTFPLFFGAKLSSAAGYLRIPEHKLKPQYDSFWKEFSGVKEWQDKQLAFYQKNGYIETLTKRRRRGPLSVNMVYNSPVQGTAADIVMDCMCRLSEKGDPEVQPEINIHDDLTFARVHEDRVEAVSDIVVNTMLRVPFDFVNVPITVEGSIGENWLEMEEFGVFSSDTHLRGK